MEEIFEECYQLIAAKINEIKKDEPNVSIVLPKELLDDSVGSKYLKGVSEILKTFTSIKNLHLEIHGNRKMENMDYQGLDFMLAAMEQHLPKLEKLNLKIESYKLLNEGAKRLMQTLKLASQVTVLNLNLSDNYIEEEGMVAIRDTLKDFKSLKELYLNLSFSNPSKGGREVMNQILDSHTTLECLNLDFSVTSYNEESIVSLANSLKNYHNLSKLYLDFDFSFIKQDGVGILVGAIEGLKSLNKLTEFSLIVGNPCEFPMEVSLRIAKLITNMPNLEYLRLYVNNVQLGEEGGSAILNALTTLKKLKTLLFNIHINYIGSEAFKNFGVKLRNLELLSTISCEMVHNNIGTEALISVLEGIYSLKKLESVKLVVQNNQLTNAVVPFFTLLLKELPLLRELLIDYGSEDESTEHFQEFVDALKNSTTIKNLKLEFNEEMQSRVDYGFVRQLRDISDEVTQRSKENQ